MCNGSISFQTELTLCQASYLHFSGSICIITSANHYNTSVDAAVVQRLENPFQTERLKERWSVWNPTVSLVLLRSQSARTSMTSCYFSSSTSASGFIPEIYWKSNSSCKENQLNLIGLHPFFVLSSPFVFVYMLPQSSARNEWSQTHGLAFMVIWSNQGTKIGHLNRYAWFSFDITCNLIPLNNHNQCFEGSMRCYLSFLVMLAVDCVQHLDVTQIK